MVALVGDGVGGGAVEEGLEGGGVALVAEGDEAGYHLGVLGFVGDEGGYFRLGKAIR